MGKPYLISATHCYACITLCILVWSLTSAKANKQNHYCQSFSIRNSVEHLKVLENCTIIEGYLEIQLMDKSTIQSFENISFPNLLEIRDYLVLYRIRGLQSIGQLFPNLTIIRGSTLFTNYALVTYQLTELKDIGLTKLSDILRGSVRIEKNPNLCYISTVDWDLIAKSGKDGHFIKANKNPGECHDICPHQDEHSLCPANGNQNDLSLCWNRYHCQKVCSRGCLKNKRACAQADRCCHPQCLGGCYGSGAADCVACRNVLYAGKCYESCPSSLFQFNSRCLTQKECEELPSRDTNPKIFYKSWKILGKARSGQCSLSCPHGYMPQGRHSCLKCQRACPKVCSGKKIDNVASAQSLDGCTAISGSLTVQMNGQGSSIYQELERFLGNIETIDGYLKIIHSAPLISLNFFRNLTVIKGNELDRKLYSFVVRGNENLQELWDWSHREKKVKIRNGRPFFHFNPKLCMNKINETMTMVGMADISDNEISARSNGDKGACNKENMVLDYSKIFPTRVFLLFDNYRKLHRDSRTILSYVISYRQVGAGQKVSLYDDRDACGNGEWKIVDYDMSEVSDNEDKVELALTDLVPDTRYAAHVRTSVIDSEPRSGFSKIIYFTTKPDYPTSPIELSFAHISENEIELKWIPPLKPNGKVTHYLISWAEKKDDADEVWQKNFCEDLSISFKSKKIKNIEVKVPSLFSNKTTIDNSTCSCSKDEKLLEADIKEQIYFENYIQNSAYKKKITKKSKRSLANDNVFTNVVSTPNPEVSTGTVFISSTPKSMTPVTSLKPQYYIRNLNHFTKYHIEVKACHDFDQSIQSIRCSIPAEVYPRTKSKADADDIDINSVHSKIDNHTLGLVHVAWKEPLDPNGIIDGYQVEYKRIDIENLKPITVCITQSKYEQNKGHTLQGLHPGKYSMRLQAISLAGKGMWTDYTYFEIEEQSTFLNTTTIITIVCSIFAILIIVVIVWRIFKRKFKTRLESAALMTSVNPEYEYIEDEWEIGRDKVKLLNPLGHGTFGMVYEGIAENPKTGHRFRCAIKTVTDMTSAKEFLKEAAVMKGFTCHHVVKLKGVCSRHIPTLVVMELMENGDLRNFLRSQRDDYVPMGNECPKRPPPKPTQLFQMAAEIADGMDYLASNKFVHRDLAARNCMVAKDMTVKIGDFGMTRDIYETDYYRKGGKGMLPVRWMAPESLKDGVYTSCSDVWSYGIVLWEMVTLACQPYPGLSNECVLNYIIGGGIMEKPIDCDDKIFNIMLSCWQTSPLLRPSFNDLVKCFVSGVNKKFKKRSYHFRGQTWSDSDDSDDSEYLDPSSPLNCSKKRTSSWNFLKRLFPGKSKRRKPAQVKKHASALSLSLENQLQEPLSENHIPADENHKPAGDLPNPANCSKNDNHSNGFVPGENTASTCC